MNDAVDVAVVGSGVAGLLAALRAHDRGLRVAVIEKAACFGGTSATSGGALWIPNHAAGADGDSREKALSYLLAVSRGDHRLDRIEAFIDNAPPTLRYLRGLGIDFDVFPGMPDYFPDAPGSFAGRALFPRELDGSTLGEAFFQLRDTAPAFKLLDRYTLDLAQSFTLAARPRGWRLVAARILAKYWLDFGWRRMTRRDRRLTLGSALIGRLRLALAERGIPLSCHTRLERLVLDGGRIAGLALRRHAKPLNLPVKLAVVLAAGGFEQSQALRDRYLPVATDARWSLTPRHANEGDALIAAQAVGAALESMSCAWWAPSMQLPGREFPNIEVTHQMFFDHRHPHSLCVNRLARRFVNESCSYDRFGMAMIEDQKRSAANIPCWMIFDATYRARHGAGGIMPSSIAPDRKIPREWWDSYLYRAATVEALAAKIDLNPAELARTVARMNEYAKTGHDAEFGRGAGAYDRYFGDPRSRPNPCLGALITPPFYAVRIDLGDLGTKGGLKTDANAQVMRADGAVIDGLYAVGNCAGAPFGDCYPGAGATLSAAAVFAFIAANAIAGAGAGSTFAHSAVASTGVAAGTTGTGGAAQPRPLA